MWISREGDRSKGVIYLILNLVILAVHSAIISNLAQPSVKYTTRYGVGTYLSHKFVDGFDIHKWVTHCDGGFLTSWIKTFRGVDFADQCLSQLLPRKLIKDLGVGSPISSATS
jgi:hypothetical protein